MRTSIVLRSMELPAILQNLKAKTLWIQYDAVHEQAVFETLRRLPEQGLAIVGTRRPQARSIRFTQQLVQSLRHHDLVILSGMALGIDSVAHRSAMAAGLITWGVLANGLPRIYPPQNIGLAQEILTKGGALLSEAPPHTLAKPYLFLQRNRLLASFSRAVCVMEAAHRSGALNTASWARELDRPCFAMPCFPGEATHAGNQKLLDAFQAQPLWGVHSLGSVWLELATADPAADPSASLSEEGRSLAEFLKRWIDVEERLPTFAEALEDWMGMERPKGVFLKYAEELMKVGLLGRGS